ncbi:pyridoxamine 5'-phosphate oxidase family protein [Mucilaginibacter myungsuensis]|uniref:Pyridoxamine 5'-phosphate oxidase family protein n=1 Tax=Mucilaginibacter myungsuensis TaxID=649104 RepID=A0A929KTR4_9SPHI|nr:pyridoxamine 5'-phosphate oxidase family protein [Mucilaginibacter myungsuensis]MBE9661406.1 pyridoxamine 5'-phosphate oxidase family protein [Mucilaginibacter myungsuensis]MDN3597549.1 pyridoxamine 5'-phosphate oxidase family protein [Mucilaginibacter myungsuensis]
MLGQLNDTQIELLLTAQVTGHLACQQDGIPYIVPINYVYRKGAIYAHSGPGKKIDIMRRNPAVCFEVDDITSVFRWRSVIVQGIFEELTDIAEKENAMQAIIHRIMPMADSPAAHPSHGITENEYAIGTDIDLIVYKINIISKTGKFEQA